MLTLPPWLQDLLLALGLVVVDTATLLPYRAMLHPAWAAFVLVAAQNLPLIWRRRWPATTLLVAGAARVGYDLLRIGFAPLPLGPAIAYYTVMSRSRNQVRVAVTVAGLAGIIASQAVPGHTEPYDFAIAALVFVAAGTGGVLSRTRQAYLRETEQRAESVAASRDLRAAAAAAAERTRIARELHDVVAHHVSLIAVQAEAAAALLEDQPQARTCVEVIARTGREALSELRQLLTVLRSPDSEPERAPAPSLDDLTTMLEQVRRAGLDVTLNVEGTAAPVGANVGVATFRLIQEALTNTIRHSGASSAAVGLRYEPGYLTVSVSDPGSDGRHDPDSPSGEPSRTTPARMQPSRHSRHMPTTSIATVAPRSDRYGSDGSRVSLERHAGLSDVAGRTGGTLAGPGFGLAGLAERVTSCGGQLTIGPTTTGGFLVSARLPAR